MLEIHNLQLHIEVDLNLIQKAVKLSAEEIDPNLNVSIVDDEAIRQINREHLGRNYPTDVLAFDYLEDSHEELLSGEIIVSAETALRVASEKGYDAIQELILYLIHGVLHLKGYDDKDPGMASAMWRQQNLIMEKLGFSNELLP